MDEGPDPVPGVQGAPTLYRGANQRMNPDFAESAPKVADFADFWPIFPADKV